MDRSATRKVSQTAPLMKVSGLSFDQGGWFDVYVTGRNFVNDIF